jgi:hypothetical protein
MAILKDTTADGVAKLPTAFKIKEITITNKIGEAIDIQPSVVELRLTESLFSPTVICNISVYDESNMIEIMPFYGLETIKVVLSRKEGEGGAEQIIEKLFYLTQYPLYGRGRNPHTQMYELVGVSFHAWKNPMLKMSRYYSGLIKDQIVKIGKDSFGLKIKTEGITLQRGKGIINIQSPLQAIDWFRRRLYTDKGSPFYFFETIQDLDKEVSLISHDMFTIKPPYRKYFGGRDLNVEEGGTKEDYDKRKVRIIDISSELKLSKFTEAPKGAYSSETNYLDIAKRRFSKKFYNYKKDFPRVDTIYQTDILMPPKSFVPGGEGGGGGGGGAPNPNLNMENLEELFYTYQEHMSLNSESFFGTPELQNYGEWTKEKTNIINAWSGVFNTLSHQVTVTGDFQLNPGKIVELMIPKAQDPQISGVGQLWDENVSGKYLVTSAVHTFKNNEYYTNFRVKRDSFVV